MRRGLTALVVALVALVGGVGATTETDPTPGVVYCGQGEWLNDAGDGCEPLPRIEEDDPRWDCKTMGNRICGPGY